MKKILLTLITLALFCGCNSKEHSHDEHAETQIKGPHGGKLFEKDGFAIEVTIYEPEIPPQSRVYVYEDGKPADLSSATLITELHRIDRVDVINYKKQDDYLIGDKIVEEPHSFDVKLKATYKGETYNWEYSSYEGRTILSNESIKSVGIEIEKAIPVSIKTNVSLNGKVLTDQFKVSKLTARFPGVVKEIKKLVGYKVEAGDVLAVIESNESLRTYELKSPRSGEVLEISSSVGEFVNELDPIITVGDLSSLWIELLVPKNDFSLLKIGQRVLVNTDDGKKEIEGKLVFLSPIADEDTQTRIARVEIPNFDKFLIPELFVEAKVVIDERLVPVAVKSEAIQKFRDWDVVFKKVGQKFEIAIIELGETDGDWVEVKSGLDSGTEYVTKNSFVVKADVMKSGASHDH